MYNSTSIITIGKYKFTRLINIPSKYLLNVYYHKNTKDVYLIEWIENNLEYLIDNVDKPIIEEQICTKMSFISEKIAKEFLRNISDNIQKHKKPIRAYECEKCGFWHVTSKINNF